MSDAPETKERTPAGKLGVLIFLGLLLAIPLFSVYLLIYDRESQSRTARQSIVAGWGAPQEPQEPAVPVSTGLLRTIDWFRAQLDVPAPQDNGLKALAS